MLPCCVLQCCTRVGVRTTSHGSCLVICLHSRHVVRRLEPCLRVTVEELFVVLRRRELTTSEDIRDLRVLSVSCSQDLPLEDLFATLVDYAALFVDQVSE